MFLFFSTECSEQQAILSPEESKHCVRVLRKKIGDEVLVTDGKGRLIHGIISTLSKDKTIIDVKSIKEYPPSEKSLHLVFAPTKNISRIEWMMEKCVEMGIHSFHPILCAHSERKVIKPERLNKIVLSAMKQSQRFHLPKIHELITLNDFIRNIDDSAKRILCHYEPGNIQLKDIDWALENYVLIGPEGDFSPEEIALLKKSNFKTCNLSNSRLRTETAAMMACATFNIVS